MACDYVMASAMKVQKLLKKSFLSPCAAKSEVTPFKQLLTAPPGAACVCSAGSLYLYLQRFVSKGAFYL